MDNSALGPLQFDFIPGIFTMIWKNCPSCLYLHCSMRNTVPILCLFLLLPVSCEMTRARNELASRMAAEENQAAENQAAENQAADRKRISELKSNIREVEREVEKTVESVRSSGTYWRLLGLKYMDYKMWGEAASAFDEAISIYPEHAFLLYNRALSIAQLSLSADTQEQKTAYLLRAEQGYRRAISIDPRFTPPMYALAILLVFEFEDPLEARSLLEDYLEIERSDIKARFLLARVYTVLGDDKGALRLYREIENIAEGEDDISRAKNLHRLIESGEYAQ